MWHIHNERRNVVTLSDVTAIAAEEGWAVVKSKRYEGVLTGNIGKGGLVHDVCISTLVSHDQGGAVRPTLGQVLVFDRICRRVNREDDVDVAHRLNARIERNILQIFAPINKSQSCVVRAWIGVVVETVGWVRGIVRNVVVVLTNSAYNAGKGPRDVVRES